MSVDNDRIFLKGKLIQELKLVQGRVSLTVLPIHRPSGRHCFETFSERKETFSASVCLQVKKALLFGSRPFNGGHGKWYVVPAGTAGQHNTESQVALHHNCPPKIQDLHFIVKQISEKHKLGPDGWVS